MTREPTRPLLISLCFAAASLGCSDGPVNIGDTHALGALLSDYAADWDGYAQAFSFGDGSDRIRLTIDENGAGTLRVGESASLPAPTDPDVGYPPGNMGMFSTSGIAPPNPGFLYPLHAAEIQSERIQLGIDFTDIYSGWCAIQSSYPHLTGNAGPAPYGCFPELSKIEHADPTSPSCTVTFLDGTTQTLDCGKVSLCLLEMVCECTATACSAAVVPAGSPVNQYGTRFDLALDAKGSTLTGTFLRGGGERVTVILKKQD
jgi:hypothetical protein